MNKVHWTKEQQQFLEDNIKNSVEDLATQLGVSTFTIRKHIRLYEIRKGISITRPYIYKEPKVEISPPKVFKRPKAVYSNAPTGSALIAKILENDNVPLY